MRLANATQPYFFLSRKNFKNNLSEVGHKET